ncbi:MAG: rod shape-determining protein [Clostridiales bacterium]|nr:rod shape-determining protein [Clostridiales bacterium]
MAVMEIAVEIGTGYTSLFLSGNGIVLREPTIIAFIGDPKNKRVRAVGTAAEQMLGKTPEHTTIIAPVVDGVIADSEACTVLLREFIKKILPSSYIFFPKIKAIVGIPTGLTVEERGMYEDVCVAAGIADVTMVDNIMLTGIGLDLPVGGVGGLLVNIGAGTTEIAAVSLSGVISGCGVTIGGNMMDNAVIDYVAGKYDVKIGKLAARKLKNEIGSLFGNDTSSMSVSGRNVRTKNSDSTFVNASELCGVLMPYYLRIADAVESIINMCPPEVAGEIYKRGIWVVGGGSKILGLREIFSQRLHLNVYLVDEPSYCTILGAGKLLGDKELLREILIQK